MSAWARGERESLRRAYIQSTLACLFVLATAALVVGVLIEPILKLWLGTVPAQTPTITRLVLIHTVIGGTAGIGRSVLLGMGRFKAYTLSALLGGVANVALALLFVLVLDLGLRGIVLATVIAVTVRCAIWMPIYILRSLRVESERPSV
jgi:O-antigen/teichoic acid export membrane protein